MTVSGSSPSSVRLARLAPVPRRLRGRARPSIVDAAAAALVLPSIQAAKSTRQTPSDDDYRALLRLAGEAAALPDGSRERRELVLSGLLALVGGVGANCFELDPSTPTGLPGKSASECYGGLEGNEATFDRYILHGLHVTDPVPPVMSERGLVAIQAIGTITQREWESSQQYQQVRRPLGLGNQIYMRFNVGDRSFGCGLHRAIGEPAFDGRAIRLMSDLARLCPGILGTIGGLGDPPAAAPQAEPDHPERIDLPADLPPRFRLVLDGLLAGDAPKQIAHKHKLSVHTVYEYTKQLYRRLGVSGRGELLALFIRRPGLDR